MHFLRIIISKALSLLKAHRFAESMGNAHYKENALEHEGWLIYPHPLHNTLSPRLVITTRGQNGTVY